MAFPGHLPTVIRKKHKCQIFKTANENPTFQTSLIEKSFKEPLVYTLKTMPAIWLLDFLKSVRIETL